MYKKHSSFSIIALLFVPCSSNHKRPGAIGMLKAGVRVSGIARYHNCLPPAVQHLRDCYQATRTVDCIDDIYIDDIRSGWLPTLPDE